MDNIFISATNRTPDVAFDFDTGHLKISGESYPEDVTRFYNPLLDALHDWLDAAAGRSCQFDFKLIYFNSSSAKVVMTLMDMLDDAAGDGATVTVRWIYDPEDDNMLELGEEFGEDLENASFELVAQESE